MAQSTLSLEIRGFEESDYPRLAEIYDAIFPERSRSVEEWQFYDDSLDKSKYYFRRYACINSATGVALGFGEMWNPPWMFHPKKFWFDGWVDPKHQRQGVGSAIYDRLKDDFDKRNGISAWMGIRENMETSIAFARKRGFNEKMRVWESTVDPYRVNTSEFQKYSTKASQARIEFSTLEQELRGDRK